MKKLLLLRGAPASGKSTFIKDNNLDPYVISSDNLRLMVAGLSMDLDGNMKTSQELDTYVDAHRNDHTLEGMVLVDDRGYMCKEKFTYYVKIKQLRGFLQSCIKAYLKGQPSPKPKQEFMSDIADKVLHSGYFTDEELENLHVVDAVKYYEAHFGKISF